MSSQVPDLNVPHAGDEASQDVRLILHGRLGETCSSKAQVVVECLGQSGIASSHVPS